MASPPIQNEWLTDVSYGTTAVAAQIQDTLVYSVHLSYRNYGPYNACLEGQSVETIRAADQLRVQQAREIERWPRRRTTFHR
ncbi:hypothetical protein [Amycolatopsis cihanbeyliensis]|uniref:hypothetical protein n=1 Tax=Amycolatopsis cihanbeyliensis TaxID=1128664 RepID=UPI0011537606|nr:hypothetical protein [Amycolatopsis cihanbeyliensis]